MKRRFIRTRWVVALIPPWAWRRILWPLEIYSQLAVARHYVGWHSQKALCVALEEIVVAFGGSVPMGDALEQVNREIRARRLREAI